MTVTKIGIALADDFVNSVSMQMPAPTNTPRILREWRAKQRPVMTQEKAAQHLGVKYRSYTRWEAGENLPYRRTIEETLAPKLKLQPEDFYPVPEDAPGTRIAHIEQMVEEMHEMITRLLEAAENESASRLLAEAKAQAGRRRSTAGRTRKN